ncbi:hypothetical protein CAI21_09225 [Alkalilimnicola ehrlichii]|uniref:Uncharacterized protein n=1 Tax=Alkalilimnicola ehrlichii TaxID=351052 RepID=A0A3E0WNS4_9GAMM|nr:hypothetical protein [Alkalilimnicola ehrlichii]RFA29982.1 hypothetical protein CAI21_09225 [Alkalilimnicola ehrlichii]RFA33801.1 hypothetical protein CAL65_16890 [Alkalilimnicola ehrlichii]
MEGFNASGIQSLSELPVPVEWLYVGVAITLLLVAMVSIRWSLRARQILAEENRARDAEQRSQQLKRDVFLPAAEAMARAQDFLGKFPGKNWTKEEGSVVVDYLNGALGKVNVVGGEHAIRTTMAVATEFSMGYMTLTTRQRPIWDLEQEVEGVDSKISHMAYERDQLLAQITRVAGEGMQEQGIWNDLNLRFDRLQRQITGALDERTRMMRERNRLKHELALEAAKSSLKLAKLTIPAYLAIRDELDSPIDDDEYRILAHSSIDELEEAVRRLSTKNTPAAAKKSSEHATRKQEEAPHERNLRMVLKGD